MKNIKRVHFVGIVEIIGAIGLSFVGCGSEKTSSDMVSDCNSENAIEYTTETDELIDNGEVIKQDYTVFKTALFNLLNNNVLPDGTEVVFDEEYYMDDNSFAIYDYDGDLESELIICWDGTADEYIVEGVYKYNYERDAFESLYFEKLIRPEDTSLIENRNGILGKDKYDEYYSLTEANIELAISLCTGDLSTDDVFDFSTPRNNHYLAIYHSDWPKLDSNMMAKNSRLGVDVSTYQGNIDFNKVKEDGYEFVIIRIGFRGYGSQGNMKADDNAISNIKKAKEAGLDVGVYFFSQAISETEAVEEAEFCFNILAQAGITEPSQLEMPIVFDPESILHDDSRTDNVTGEQFTANCVAFCDEVESRGFKSMIYANTTWEAYKLDLGLLSEYSMWYADYADEPQTPYAFEMWQYTEKGIVNGIAGEVDLDIQYLD